MTMNARPVLSFPPPRNLMVRCMLVRYEANDKHKKPWQPGRKGSLCPSDIDETKRNDMLERSQPDPLGSKKRYGTDGSRAFCAQEHAPDVFHGYPVGWKEVPESLRRKWMDESIVSRRAIQRFWDGIEER